MPTIPPEPLRALLSTTDAGARDSAWAAFLTAYSDIILQVARAMGGDHDAVMDRYTFALDALRRDECRRLRGYAADGRGTFSTWLAIVVRRLCLDEYRHRYGRVQAAGAGAADRHAERRSLADLVGSELGLEMLESAPNEAPDATLERTELRAALDAALGRLDPTDRLILRLRFEDDLPVPEIARLLSLGSKFNLYRRITRLLAEARRGLESSGIDNPVK